MATNYSRGDRPVPDFELVQPLGRGGFGVVWKANGPGGVEAALKIINLTAKQGFKEFRGLQRVKNIRHPNLVVLSGFWLKDEFGNLVDGKAVDEHDSAMLAQTIRGTLRSPLESSRPAELIIAMGLGDKTLADRLQECTEQGLPGIPPEELLPYMEDAARGIDYLNAQSVQHCDIKPSNIMIVGDAALVCDFGLARVMGDVKATSPAMSVAYSAPEVLEHNQPSSTTDQYSLAITYHELRTGALPFPEASPLQVMHFHMRGELDFARLSPAEQHVMRKATSLDPRGRYASSVAMVRALRHACQSEKGALGSDQAFRAPPSAAPRARQPGEIVPGYRLEEEIARSGDDQVWQAKGVEGEVALLIRDLTGASATFELEALETIKGLEHNCLTELRAYWLLDAAGKLVVGTPEDADTLADATQLVVLGRLARKTLKQVLDEHVEMRGSGLEAPAALRYLKQVAEGVDYLNAPIHQVSSGRSVSIQHRAIQPENIMCFGDSVKLGNFLSACVLEGAGTSVATAPESSAVCAPPEAYAKFVTRWSDQYSLAVMYYQLRTGTLPCAEAPTAEHVPPGGAPCPLNLELLPEVERPAIAQATSVNPEDRFDSCLELVEALEQVVPAEVPEVEEVEEEQEQEQLSHEGGEEIDLSLPVPERHEPRGPQPAPGPTASSIVIEAPPRDGTPGEPPEEETPGEPSEEETPDLTVPVRETDRSGQLKETVPDELREPPPPEPATRGTESGLLDDRYQLLEPPVGEGAFAKVYRARDTRLDKDVAVKVLRIEHTSDPAGLVQLRELFRREAQVSARLNHPNIVQVSDAHVSPSGVPYVVSEFLEGIQFREVIRSESPLELDQAEEILEQLCSAVDFAHEENIVHRDLKPGNLMLVYSRTGRRLKVLDFGLAKLVDQAPMSLTQGAPIGTPHYMSPEQHRGEPATPQSDIYAIGIILFEMLTGRPPFDVRGTQQLQMLHELHRLHCEAEPPDVTAKNPDLPPALNAVIHKALAKDPRERYATATELLEAFREAVKPPPKPVEADQRAAKPIPIPGPPSRRWVKAAVVGATVVAASGVVALIVASIIRNKPPVVVANATVSQSDSQKFQFSAKGSYDADGEIAKVVWEPGDDDTELEGPEVSHEYGEPGEYEVVVTVTDDRGAETKKTLAIHVKRRTKPEEDLRSAYALFPDADAAERRFNSLLDDQNIQASASHLARVRLGRAIALWMLQAESEDEQHAKELDNVWTQLEEDVKAGALTDENVRWQCLQLLRSEPAPFMEGLTQLRRERWFELDKWLQDILHQRAQGLKEDALANKVDDPNLVQLLVDYFEFVEPSPNWNLRLKRVELLVQGESWKDARPEAQKLYEELGNTSLPQERQRRAELLWLTAVVGDRSSPVDNNARSRILARTIGPNPEQEYFPLLVGLYRRDTPPNKQLRAEVVRRLQGTADKSLATTMGELVEEEIRDAFSNPFRGSKLVEWAKSARDQKVAGDVTLAFLAESYLDSIKPDVEGANKLLSGISKPDSTGGYADWVRGMAQAKTGNPQDAIAHFDLAFKQKEKAWQTLMRKEDAGAVYETAGRTVLAEDAEQAFVWLNEALRLHPQPDSNATIALRLDLADAAVRKQPTDPDSARNIIDALLSVRLSDAQRFRALTIGAQAWTVKPDAKQAVEAYLEILEKTEKPGGELADLREAAKERGKDKPCLLLFDDVIEPGLRIGEQWRSQAGNDPQAARVVARLHGHKGRIIYENLYEDWPFEDPLAVALEAYEKAGEIYPQDDIDRAQFYVWRAYLSSQRIARKEDVQTILDLAAKAKQAAKELSGSWFVEGLGYHKQALYALNDQQAALDAEEQAVKSLTEAIEKAKTEMPGPQPELREAYYRTRSAALVIEANYLLDIDAKALEESRKRLEQSLEDANQLSDLVDEGDSDANYRVQMAKGNALEDLAWRCGQHHRYEEAIKAFEAAAEDAAPGNVRPLMSMGRVNFKRYAESGIREEQHLQDAVTDLQRAVDTKPDDEQLLAESHLWLGAAKILRKDYDGGIEHISEGIELAQAEWLRLALRVVGGTELQQAQAEQNRADALKLSAAIRQHCKKIVEKSNDWQPYVARIVAESWAREDRPANALTTYETALMDMNLSDQGRVTLLAQKIEFVYTHRLDNEFSGDSPPILRDVSEAVRIIDNGAIPTPLSLRVLWDSALVFNRLTKRSGLPDSQLRAYLRSERENYEKGILKLNDSNRDAWIWYRESGYTSASLFLRFNVEADRQRAIDRLKIAADGCPDEREAAKIEKYKSDLEQRAPGSSPPS